MTFDKYTTAPSGRRWCVMAPRDDYQVMIAVCGTESEAKDLCARLNARNVLVELRKLRDWVQRDMKRQEAENAEQLTLHRCAVQVHRPHYLRGAADAYREAIELIESEEVGK